MHSKEALALVCFSFLDGRGLREEGIFRLLQLAQRSLYEIYKEKTC